MSTNAIVNKEKFQSLIRDLSPKLSKYAEPLTDKLIKLLGEVPSEFDTKVPPDSASYTYDWFVDHILDTIVDTFVDGGDQTEVEGQIDEEITDAMYSLADVMDLMYNNARSLIERTLDLMEPAD